MPKVNYNGITFDSELEVEYYKKLMADRDVIDFTYHPKQPIAVTKGNNYYPDFVAFYSDSKDYLRCEIIECKGYSQYSFMKDNMIHNIMLSKTETELNQWLLANGLYKNCPVVYKKIKYLKAYGFVDWDFKNPNTLANKRKEKINDLSAELKESYEHTLELLKGVEIYLFSRLRHIEEYIESEENRNEQNNE